jgi:hypothetical protein
VVIHIMVVATSLIGGITFLARGEKPGEIDVNKEGEG